MAESTRAASLSVKHTLPGNKRDHGWRFNGPRLNDLRLVCCNVLICKIRRVRLTFDIRVGPHFNISPHDNVQDRSLTQKVHTGIEAQGEHDVEERRVG